MCIIRITCRGSSSCYSISKDSSSISSSISITISRITHSSTTTEQRRTKSWGHNIGSTLPNRTAPPRPAAQRSCQRWNKTPPLLWPPFRKTQWPAKKIQRSQITDRLRLQQPVRKKGTTGRRVGIVGTRPRRSWPIRGRIKTLKWLVGTVI